MAAILAGCTDSASGPGADGALADALQPCSEGKARCQGNTYQVCENAVFADKIVCKQGETCDTALGGCAQCTPGQPTCVGDDIHACTAAGKPGIKTKPCGEEKCLSGKCYNACEVAAAQESYVGCRYWPTVTLNSQLYEDFNFAVVVANAEPKACVVTVSTAANAKLVTATVAANSVATLTLPWVDLLKQSGASTTGERSVLAASGAYFLQSSQPVSVYQFNALQYQLYHNCKQGRDPDRTDNKCYSHSNDASLLLPEHTLAREYMVIARPTHAYKRYDSGVETSYFSPGFFAVAAPKEGDTTLKVVFSARTQAGAGSLNAYAAGQTGTFTLSRWGVLQIASEIPSSCTVVKTENDTGYCDLSKTTDLTGTVITADKEVAVFSGHNCTFVPHDKWACDHLEEQLFPLQAWGRRYMGTHTASSGKDPSLYRVVSADDNNTITFLPAVHAPITLNRGQYADLRTTADFQVSGGGRFALAQFMVGQNYSSTVPGKGTPPNDPAMALAVPVEQYRKSYRFLAPDTYDQNYVNVIAPQGASIKLDNAPIGPGSFTKIGSTGYMVAKRSISGGAHKIESTKADFGIAVYGVGAYTPYMYPGGLNLKVIP